METNEEKSHREEREELERWVKDFKLPERDHSRDWVMLIPTIISVILTVGAVWYGFSTMHKGGIPECRCMNVKTDIK